MECTRCKYCEIHSNEDLSRQATFTCLYPANKGYRGILHWNGCQEGVEVA